MIEQDHYTYCKMYKVQACAKFKLGNTNIHVGPLDTCTRTALEKEMVSPLCAELDSRKYIRIYFVYTIIINSRDVPYPIPGTGNCR